MNIGAPELVMVIGLILTVLNIIDKCITLYRQAHAPELEQNKRLDALEQEMANVKLYLDNDNQKIRSLEVGNRVILHSMSALLAHGIDGNNVNELVEAKKDLDEFLINR